MVDYPAPAERRSMRILMYAKSLKREGGTEISGVQIARALSERGHVVDLLYEHDGDLRTEYLSFCRSVARRWMSVKSSRFEMPSGSFRQSGGALVVGRRSSTFIASEM